MPKYRPAPEHYGGAIVLCSRNGDGRDTFAVDLSEVRFACVRTRRGGDFHPFADGPKLCVMVRHSLIPDDLRSGRHMDPARWKTQREPSAYAVVEPQGTDLVALAWLEMEGARQKFHGEDHERKHRRIARRDARKRAT
jgi:hypothetical protein